MSKFDALDLAWMEECTNMELEELQREINLFLAIIDRTKNKDMDAIRLFEIASKVLEEKLK